MARRKNVKRIDPRYFLEETTHRDDFGRLDEFFGPFSKDSKTRKAGQKILAGWIKKGTADDMSLPNYRGLETEILPWMGKGRIDDDYPEGYTDDLGRAAMYIAKLSRDQEATPEEEKAFQDVFRRDIEGRQAASDAYAARRADDDAKMAKRRNPEMYSAQLERAKKRLMGPVRSPDDLARALKIQDLERAAKNPQFAVDNLFRLIPILKKVEDYFKDYNAALRAIETTKGEMERYGVELPEVISNLESVQQRIDKTVASNIRAYFKKAFKNVEQADKERQGRSVADQEMAGRVGAGSRLAPGMSDADAQRGYTATGGLRSRMSESQLKQIIKEEIQKALKSK